MRLLAFPPHWIQANGNLRPHIRITMLAIAYIAMGIFLFWKGQPLICECGYIKLWENDIMSNGNSQHIADWYTLSHFLHGTLIVLAWRLFFPKLPMRYAFIAGIFTAVTWEVVEHLDIVMERFREQTVSLGYWGDAVINSVADATFMSLGLYTATRLKIKHILAVILTFEIISATFARDSLILSTVMLIYPIEPIKEWQLNRPGTPESFRQAVEGDAPAQPQ